MSELLGQKAPNFTLLSSEGELVSLKDFRGRNIVLFFYPKDGSVGCSLEAIGFKSLYEKLLDSGAIVFGVSPDNIKSHKQFIRKFDLPFPLLSDLDHMIAEKYGVWMQKTMFGKEHWGVGRTTFIVNKEGIVTLVINNAKAEDHAGKTLDYLTSESV